MIMCRRTWLWAREDPRPTGICPGILPEHRVPHKRAATASRVRRTARPAAAGHERDEVEETTEPVAPAETGRVVSATVWNERDAHTAGRVRGWGHRIDPFTLTGSFPATDRTRTMTDLLQRLLDEKGTLLADGATGTNLFAMGLQTGEPPELWNLDHPDRVRAHYQSFVDAGSDIVLSNSFGGTRYRLKLHGSEDRVGEINEAAARLAREVADAAARPVVVAGSMGPTGELFEPLGALTHDSVREAFAEQAQALARGGVDVLWIETLSSQEEVDAAIEGAETTGLSVVCTVSFDTNGRTMMGIAPESFARHCCHGDHPPLAFGTNCGVGASELVAAVLNLRRGADDAAVIVAKANCGIPEWHDGELTFNGTPELMADYAVLARDAGARIVGGCCGTTPEHVRAMRTALDTTPPGEPPDLATVEARLGQVSTGARAQHRGELDPEAGSASGGGGRGGRRRRGRAAS